MEDAAISELDIGNGNSIFGVFDGHGGKNLLTKEHKYQNLSKKYL
jgi:serine/threonine protein phosphatase PrpC